MAGTHHASVAVGPEATERGLRAIRIAAVGLALTAGFQLVIFAIGGSAGLLAAALDNLGDVITTAALGLAFVAARRAADRRYTFGYSRLEDLAGVFVVLVIWAGAGIAAFESLRKLTGRHSVDALGWGLAAALTGAVGNEIVARYKMHTGREIDSPALVADGKHARIDALASIAAAAGLIGVRAGWEDADPIAGLVITLAIVAIAWDASRHVLARLLDAVDPALVARIEHLARDTKGVGDVGRVQARYAGRSLYVTVTVAADGALSLDKAHRIGEALHHNIVHELPSVAQVDVHVDPWEAHGARAHAETLDHGANHAEHEHHFD
jgi:cation diffusion facilitator family transporter